MNNKFTGLGVALVTPFDKKLDLDLKSLEKLVSHTIRNGLDYFVVQGTTGESVTVNQEEKIKVLHTVIDKKEAGKPVVFGCGGNDTRKIIKDLHNLKGERIDAILSVCPAYNKPSQRGLIEHFNRIADESPFPVILYNVPGRTAVNLSAESTLSLANHENIIGTKEASGDLTQCIEIAKHKPDTFLLISGDDLLTLPLIAIGGCGVISVLGNYFTSLMKEIVYFGMAGKLKEAQRALYQISEINPLMYREGNPSGIKTVLELAGICESYVRPPLCQVSEDLKSKIAAAFKKIK